jgi:hypothetical protein
MAGCAVVLFLRAMFVVSKGDRTQYPSIPQHETGCARRSKSDWRARHYHGREASQWSRICAVSSIRHWAYKFC